MLFIFIVLYLLKLIQLNAFILHDTFNNEQNNDVEIYIEELLNEEHSEITHLNVMDINNIDDQFRELEKMAKEHASLQIKDRSVYDEKDIEPIETMNMENEFLETTIEQPLTQRAFPEKRMEYDDYRDYIYDDSVEQSYYVQDVLYNWYDDSEGREEYNYEELLKEYYDEAVEDSTSNNTYHPRKLGEPETGIRHSLKMLITFDTETRNCTEEEINNIGLKALNCIVQDYKHNHTDTKTLISRLWRIVKIWFLFYMAVAVPMWCTMGYCCCCLYCKFFKPHQTMAEAKQYLISNPPGIFRTEKNGVMQYAPTESEVDAYEKLDNILKSV